VSWDHEGISLMRYIVTAPGSRKNSVLQVYAVRRRRACRPRPIC